MGDKLKGRNAVVTGAGRGIGRAIAIGLAEEGANVVVCDIGGLVDGSGGDKTPAEQVVDQCKKHGVKAIAQYGDVSNSPMLRPPSRPVSATSPDRRSVQHRRD